jgi:hypothetical protein
LELAAQDVPKVDHQEIAVEEQSFPNDSWPQAGLGGDGPAGNGQKYR